MKVTEQGDRQHRIRELFEEVSGMPVGEQSAYLDRACDGDLELREEVTDLLRESGSADSPLEGLVSEMLLPALESLGSNPAHLESWLADDSGSDESDPLIGTTVAHFEIVAQIGRGGMGMVYQARDLNLDRTVAMKFLPPAMSTDQAAKERFVHEAQAASGLDHPNIATVYEIGETDDRQLFIAMGYYPGETLNKEIARGPIEPERVLDYAIQLAGALDRVHGNGVVHRDIKPGNLMVTKEGSVKLLDFGLAKLSYATGHTQVGQMIGTVAYMSPEQAKADAVDHRTDIWSLGVVLYETLTGKRPFDRGDVQSTIHAILDADPEPPESLDGEVPGPLKDVLGLCLAKDPDRRYQNAGDLLADLQRAKEGLFPSQRGGRATWKGRRRRRRWVIGGALAGVLIASAILIALIENPAGKRQVAGTGEAIPVIFTPVTEGSIAEDLGNFIGSAWGDFDNDGFVDVILTDQSEGGRLRHHRNVGDGRFVRVTDSFPATDLESIFGLVSADVDNDGDLDLFVTADENAANQFYRNDGAGSFVRVTEGDWVNTPSFSHGPAWGDYDADGWLDLFVANSGLEKMESNFLYRNRGDGTMESVETAFTETEGLTHSAIWSDFDGDGDVDLLVSGQDPLMYRNDGDGLFSGFHAEEGGIPEYTEDSDIGLASADYDNDGDLDIVYITWKPSPGVLLYRNNQNRIFTDVTHVLPSEDRLRAGGVAWGDYDNDGYQDMLITNFSGKNRLYHNDGGGSFSRVVESPVEGSGNNSTRGSWVDYDNDGDLDVFVVNGLWATFKQTCDLYRNEGGPNNWIVLTLVGTDSNRSAIGAKVWVKATVSGHEMMQLREIQSGGLAHNGADQRVHFGLGDATTVDTLRIEWPSGIVQELHDVAADQFLSITEEPGQPASGG